MGCLWATVRFHRYSYLRAADCGRLGVSMRIRRLVCFLLGVWVGISLILALNAYLTFSAIDEVMRTKPGLWGASVFWPGPFSGNAAIYGRRRDRKYVRYVGTDPDRNWTDRGGSVISGVVHADAFLHSFRHDFTGSVSARQDYAGPGVAAPGVRVSDVDGRNDPAEAVLATARNLRTGWTWSSACLASCWCCFYLSGRRRGTCGGDGITARSHSRRRLTSLRGRADDRFSPSVRVRVLGNSAKTLAAQTESGSYRGPIIGETEHYLIQRQSSRTALFTAEIYEQDLPEPQLRKIEKLSALVN